MSGQCFKKWCPASGSYVQTVVARQLKLKRIGLHVLRPVVERSPQHGRVSRCRATERGEPHLSTWASKDLVGEAECDLTFPIFHHV